MASEQKYSLYARSRHPLHLLRVFSMAWAPCGVAAPSFQVIDDLNQMIQAAVVCHAVREKCPRRAGDAMMHAPFGVAMFRQEVL